VAAVVAFLALAVLGPRARVDDAVRRVDPPRDVEAWLRASEDSVPGIREGDRKEIMWAHDDRRVTDVSLVYLHGFSADRHELDPVPAEIARALDANLFYTRLAGHGRDGPAMAEASADDWLQDTEEALAVGGRIGSRVVVMGTSTGGTLAAWAAAQDRWRGELLAVVLVSPNFGVRDGRAGMLLWPWGGLLARLVVGPERCFEPANAEQARHWTTCYPTRALLPMMALVDHVRALDPNRVVTPVLVLYSPDDRVVDPSATERAFAGFASRVKRIARVEGSAAGEHHVLAGDILSPEYDTTVVADVLDFVRPLAAVTSEKADTVR
jgi:alpha-beta hydrolase superfamily lysophospholipase